MLNLKKNTNKQVYFNLFMRICKDYYYISLCLNYSLRLKQLYNLHFGCSIINYVI